jgi:hypothetical protein
MSVWRTFEVAQLERDVVRKAPPIVRPLVIGVARANGQSA